MTVSLTISSTIAGSQYSDSLQGGGSGVDFGTVEAGLSSAYKNLYIRHDGLLKISNLSIYAKEYSQTYGGEYSAALDYLKALSQGDLGSGVQLDMDWDGAVFATVSIITTGSGSAIANAIEVPYTAMLKNNGGVPAAPTAPLDGELGASGDAALGDVCLIRAKWVAPSSEPSPGRRQIDFGIIYNFTT
jgi:hypothetical protein